MSDTTNLNHDITFDFPKNQSNVIKVVGVGGGGSNAINHMFRQGIKGVDFVICNTDAQALENSPVPVKIQLGVSLTEGLGAGANPDIGEQSAIESMEEIHRMLETNTKMVFITAGMGGGTGTGAAPVIARMAKEMDILTVGIVTIPFSFEGKTRNEQAQIGVEKLRQNVDSLIVINNNKLREVYGNLGFKAGFSKADEVLATAARGIAEVITHHYTQNIDLRDAKTVLSESGTAIMGSATASGSNRAKEAINQALDSPLLNDNKIRGAKNVLLLIVSGSEEITIDEIGEISDYIQEEAGHSANIIMGVGEDENLEGAVSITVIATGFDVEQQDEITNTEPTRIIHTLEDDQKAEQKLKPRKTAAPIQLPDLPARKSKNKPEEIIRHTLFDDPEPEPEIRLPFKGFVKTSEMLKNIPVSWEEVKADISDFEEVTIKDLPVEEFIIIEAPKQEAPEKEGTGQDEQLLKFNFPANEEEPEVYEEKFTASEIEEEPVKESGPEASSGIIRYNLEDYEQLEEELNRASPQTQKEEPDTGGFQLKTREEPVEVSEDNTEPDPLNSSIAELLRSRTAERKRKMKEFNYRFKNSPSRIDEIEKQPAYKRLGIDLNQPEDSPNISRTSLNTDDDDIEFRRNNSFLHDNVD